MNKFRIMFISFSFAFLSLLFANIVYAAKQEKIIIIDNTSCWKYDNNKWYNYDYYDNENNFNVYIDNNYYGNYKIKKADEYSLYDNNNKNVTYTGDFIAISSNFNIDIKTYALEKVDKADIHDINKILNSTFTDDDLTINEKAIVDINNDGQKDAIINVSNLDAEKDESIFSNLVFIKLNNGDIQILINESIEAKDALNSPNYNIKYVLDGNNEYYRIIIQKRYFSYAGEATNILYEATNGKYYATTIYETKNENNSSKNVKTNYTMYIFCGVLLIVFLIGYLIFSKIKKEENNMDV